MRDEYDPFDSYEYRKDYLMGRIRPARHRVKRDYMGREFYDQNGECHSRNGYPYSFSEIIHWMKDRPKDARTRPRPKDSEAAYSDRLQQWNYAAYQAACRESKGRLWEIRPEQVSEFLTRYFGRATEALGLVEGCNASSGYPYFIFFYKHTERKYKANEYTQISTE